LFNKFFQQIHFYPEQRLCLTEITVKQPNTILLSLVAGQSAAMRVESVSKCDNNGRLPCLRAGHSGRQGQSSPSTLVSGESATNEHL